MYKYKLFIFFGLISLFSCKHDLDVDISQVELKELSALSLNKDFFALNINNFEKKNKELQFTYGPFYNNYVKSFLNPLGVNDSSSRDSILHFIADKTMKQANYQVNLIYSSGVLNEISKEVTNCVKRYKYHFKNRIVPNRFITCTTGFNFYVASSDSALIAGLDMYLGDTSIFYSMLQLPDYQKRCMRKAYILPDLMRGWMLTEFDNDNPINNLLNHTIFYGKIYYAVNALLPNTPDSLLIGYTDAQLNYCKKFEKNLWGYFAEKNRLYENNLKTVQELTTEGPFTAAISKDCPPRIAMWVGWQIVKSYMKENKNITLKDLLKEKDAQKILSKSKYRP
jgi:hypothetical protein